MDQTTKYDQDYEDMDVEDVLSVVEAAEMKMFLNHRPSFNSDQPNELAAAHRASLNSGQPYDLPAVHRASFNFGKPNESTALENTNASSKMESMPKNETTSNDANNNENDDGFEEMLILVSLEAEKKYEAALVLLLCAQEFRINNS